MKVVLLERVEKLGLMGDVVNVKMGYARNFLIPFKKASRATKENLELFETRKLHLEAENIKKADEAHKIAKKMENISLIIIRQASEIGHLYGSVRPKDIAISLEDKSGIKIDKNQVKIISPIKVLGIHKVAVLLHPEVSVNINVQVAQSLEEAIGKEENEDTVTEKK